MTPSDITKIETGGDPVLEFFKWFAILAVIALVGAAPVMSYLRKFNADRAASSKDQAESTLYQHMSERVQEQQKQLDTIYALYNELFQKHSEAVARLSKVEEYEATIQAMKIRLDEKDAKLDEKDKEISAERAHNRQLTIEVISLKDRISELEQRLLRDEQEFCRKCPLAQAASLAGIDSSNI